MARYKFNLRLAGPLVDDAFRQRVIEAHTGLLPAQFDQNGARIVNDPATEFQRVLDYYEDQIIARLEEKEVALSIEDERQRRRKAFQDALK
ncbi:MAG: hypothetical protein U0Z53_28995 [Blastocatellia bacterium]